MFKVKYVLLRLMASDYSFGILKPFFRVIHVPRSLVVCVVSCGLLFVLFRLAIVLYFTNISVISWWSVLLLKETRVLGENNRHATSH